MPVNLRSEWADLLPEVATPSTRRGRWAQWLRLARAAGAGNQARDWVTDHECGDCMHRRGGWCQRQGLPCTVNPVLTMRAGMPGMACMGMGRERRAPMQMTLNLAPNR